MNNKKLTVIGFEHLTLKPIGWGMFEIWCEVWTDGERTPEKDGYFLKSTLKVKESKAAK